MIGVFSELEQNMISQRVKSGMQNARAKCKTIGRPPLEPTIFPVSFISTIQNTKGGSQQERAFPPVFPILSYGV